MYTAGRQFWRNGIAHNPLGRVVASDFDAAGGLDPAFWAVSPLWLSVYRFRGARRGQRASSHNLSLKTADDLRRIRAPASRDGTASVASRAGLW